MAENLSPCNKEREGERKSPPEGRRLFLVIVVSRNRICPVSYDRVQVPKRSGKAEGKGFREEEEEEPNRRLEEEAVGHPRF